MPFTVKTFLFLLSILLCSLAVAQKPVDGSYRINGKEGKLAYLLAQKGEPFHDMPTTVLIFTEKDAGRDAKPDEAARMGRFGDALVVKLCKTDWGWDVLGGEFVHPAIADSHRASSSGIVKAKDVKVANGEITGRLKTDPGEKFLGQPIDVDLRFQVKQP